MNLGTEVRSGVPVSDVDPFSSESLADPYPWHAVVRDLGPVVRLERYDAWAMARHAQVYEALGDADTYCSSAGVGYGNWLKEKPWRPPSIILEADPPMHGRARSVLARVLSNTALRRMRETFERAAHELVETLAQRASFDAIADCAEAFPLDVFPDAVGLTEAGRDNLSPYGNAVFNSIGPDNALLATANADAARVGPWILAQCRREALAAGGLGADIYASVDRGEITEDEAGLLVRSLLSAGLDTTIAGIGNALYCLATHPGHWAKLHANPALARAAFEEALRFESPVQHFFRTTTRDVRIDGVTIPAREKVLMVYAAANRDPRVWNDPGDFDITRRVSRNVAFGAGIHFCVGAMLARLEAEILLSAMARRFRTLEPAGEPARTLNNSLRGLRSLPVKITMAARSTTAVASSNGTPAADTKEASSETGVP